MRQIRDYLRSAGLSVWTDEQLTPGTQRWNVEVEAAIENASCVVALLSPTAKESEWVGRELDYAITQRKAIFPALINGDERSAIPLSLISMQWLDLRSLNNLPLLVKAITNHLNREATQPAVKPATRSISWLVSGLVALVVIGVGLLILLSSRALFTSQPTPTVTETQATPQIADTQSAIEASLTPDCPNRITDDFTGPSANDWFIETSESSSISINNGSYEIAVMEINDPSSGVSWGSLREVTLDNATVEATMRASLFTGTISRIGLWLRYQDANNFLAFMISSSGKYRIARFESSYTSLVDWTDSAAIQTGNNAVNVLRVESSGSTFDFYINDTFISRVTDATWADGRLAFFGSTNEPPTSFYLDSIVICQNEA